MEQPKAPELNPDMPQTHFNLAMLVLEEGKIAEAVEHLGRAVDLKPDYLNALSALGGLLCRQGEFDRAMAFQQRVLAQAPQAVNVHTNKAILLLIHGKFEEGWKEWEWRWKLPQMAERRWDQPRWQGEDIAGKTILLHAEQGFGDTLFFSRYATMV